VESSQEIEGREFDWFASDKDGRLALFATNGNGSVPESVLASVKAHDELGSSLAVVGWGTPAVWQSYARSGLYAFDWSEEQGSYVRVAVPTTQPSIELQARIRGCSSLASLGVSFALSEFIQPTWVNVT
jgi:hypothetical protein